MTELITENPTLVSDKNIFHTIIIAKSLTYVDEDMIRCQMFWRGFKEMFNNLDDMRYKLESLRWNEFSNLLFTLSKVKLLTMPQEWHSIEYVLLDKIKNNYD